MNLLGPSFALLLMLLSTFFLGEQVKQLRRTQYRAQVYLCAHQFMTIKRAYMVRMSRFNQVIRTSFIVSNSPLPPPAIAAAKVIHQSSKVAQQLLHLSYLKQIMELSLCSRHQSLGLGISLPYQTLLKAKLVRHIDGVPKLNRNPSALIILPHHYQGPALYLNYQLKSPMGSELDYSWDEWAIEDLSNWRQLIGLVSSLLSS